MAPAPVQPSAVQPAPLAAPLRLRQVDSLRAIAAGAVMWTHFAESLRPYAASGPSFLGFLFTLPPYVNLGRIGVMIFFAVSGFVICRSFGGGRVGGERRFLIRRFCRLYPAFWVSVATATLLWWLSGREGLNGSLVAANAAMVPGLFGQPFLLGIYWTLQIELIFYALCLGLFRAGWLDRPSVLGALALGLAVLPRAVRHLGRDIGYPLALPGDGDTWMIALAVMCWAAVFRLVYDGTGGFRRRPFADRGTWLLLLLTLALVDLHDPHFKQLLWHGQRATGPDQMGSILALAIFACWVACLRVESRPLTSLGVISYSLYLFHPVVLSLVLSALGYAHSKGMPAPPLWAGMAVCTALSVGLSAATYRWVEQPAIALGKRWVGAPRCRMPGSSS